MSEEHEMLNTQAIIQFLLDQIGNVHTGSGLNMVCLSFADPDEQHDVKVGAKYVFHSIDAAILGVQLMLDLFEKTADGSPEAKELKEIINQLQQLFKLIMVDKGPKQ